MLPSDAIRPSGVVESLDVSIWQEPSARSNSGIKDIRTDKRIDFVGGIRAPKSWNSWLRKGKRRFAFSLYATTIEDLLRCPMARDHAPKSTWFDQSCAMGYSSIRSRSTDSFGL